VLLLGAPSGVCGDEPLVDSSGFYLWLVTVFEECDAKLGDPTWRSSQQDVG
jgi:hypothetical protein